METHLSGMVSFNQIALLLVVESLATLNNFAIGFDVSGGITTGISLKLHSYYT
jgi:hypothetical protein